MINLKKFKCLACGEARGAPGSMVAEGWTKMVFLPADAPKMSKWFSQGAKVGVVTCRSCGLVHMYTDVERVEEMTGEAETRCRKCRYILKGLSAPRCPECGEPI